MTVFITQGCYSQSALSGMLGNPEDRTEAVRGLIEATGARMIDYFATLGEYDFMVIAEGDGPLQDYVAGLVAAAVGGGVSNLRTTVGMRGSEVKAAFEKAGAIAAGFRSAGT